MEIPKFEAMQKIGRLSRGCTITEKIDGTNASIYISDPETDPNFGVGTQLFLTGSRTRWITPTDDNYGFSRWAHEHKDELMQLGPGHHFGEWWGLGIQRRYGLTEKRFSLFNTNRWKDKHPSCVGLVPVIFEGLFSSEAVENSLSHLRMYGSMAVPGFMQPEGIVIYHHATKQLFKKTLEKDEQPKGQE